ncbi:MAG TPA: UbiA family prenyltransferase, partial [Ktedonobacteraceae bacterium]
MTPAKSHIPRTVGATLGTPKVWRGLALSGQFIRFSTASFSLILPLLGAATVSTQLTNNQLLALIGVAMTFHIFAYVLNDVVDLPVDRTESLRADFPLVQGLIRPWQALVVALLQLPLGLILTLYLKANLPAYIFLLVAFLLMAIYDLRGKRAPFPPLTDLVQAVGWGAIVLYGAAIVPAFAPGLASGRTSALLATLFAFVIVFILLINGVHGGVRDLANDLRCGARTTAILFGARPLEGDRVEMPIPFKIYALTLQTLVIGSIFLPLAYNWFDYPPTSWYITTGIVFIFSLLSLISLIISATAKDDRQRMIFAGTVHIITSLSALLLAFAVYLGPRLLSILLVVYIIPLCSIAWHWSAKG